MRAPLMLLLIAAALLVGCGGGSRSATTPGVAHIRGTYDPDPDGLGPVNAPTSAPHRRLPPLHACPRTYRQDLEMDAPRVAGGEAAWSVDCRRGRRLVHLAIAD